MNNTVRHVELAEDLIFEERRNEKHPQLTRRVMHDNTVIRQVPEDDRQTYR